MRSQTRVARLYTIPKRGDRHACGATAWANTSPRQRGPSEVTAVPRLPFLRGAQATRMKDHAWSATEAITRLAGIPLEKGFKSDPCVNIARPAINRPCTPSLPTSGLSNLRSNPSRLSLEDTKSDGLNEAGGTGGESALRLAARNASAGEQSEAWPMTPLRC